MPSFPSPWQPLRVGDADRDAAAQLLGQHYTDGRLTFEEFLHRLTLVLGARTAADLDFVFGDLPATISPPALLVFRRRTSSTWRVVAAAATACVLTAGGVAAGAAATSRTATVAQPTGAMYRYSCSQCADRAAAAGTVQQGGRPVTGHGSTGDRRR